MLERIKNHPIISILIVFFVVVIISNLFQKDDNDVALPQDTTSTSSYFQIAEYKGFDDCVVQLQNKVSILNLPIECSFLQMSCDEFKVLQLDLIKLQSEIDMKYALPKDASPIYKDFVDSNEIFWGLPKGSTDVVKTNWDEMILAYKYLRVALEEGDNSRIEELTITSKEPIDRVSQMCSKVPPSEG